MASRVQFRVQFFIYARRICLFYVSIKRRLRRSERRKIALYFPIYAEYRAILIVILFFYIIKTVWLITAFY